MDLSQIYRASWKSQVVKYGNMNQCSGLKILNYRRPVLWVLFVFACVFVGCEDVIDIALSKSAPRLVIQGFWTNNTYSHFIITRTTDYFSPEPVELVSGAFIQVCDQYGRYDTLYERSKGFYIPRFVPNGTGTYTATVTVEGKTYTASSTFRPRTPIDSLTAIYQSYEDVGVSGSIGYKIHVHFKDRANDETYARILPSFNNGYPYLYYGKYSDGRIIDYELQYSTYPPHSQVTVTLYSMDRAMYTYYLALQKVIAYDTFTGTEIRDVTPSNPVTNWDNGALGYFGAFLMDEKTITMGD